MRLRMAVALLALAPTAFATAAGADTTIARPAYITITMEGAESPFEQPTFQVTAVDVDAQVLDGDVTPHLDCTSSWMPAVAFAVNCVAVDDNPIVLTNDVTVSGFQCENPAVSARIAGPAPLEFVTGRIDCGDPVQTTASCTAQAIVPNAMTGQWSGACFQGAPNGPIPIRCSADLSGVQQDSWSVTCYGTDP